MFRVFGSPYTLVLHQHVTYLRIKQLPFKVYCTSLTTTLLYGLIYGARNAFCCLTPAAASRLQVWQLAESAELDEDLLKSTTLHGQDGEVKYIGADGTPLSRPQRILVNKRTHPQLHLATWSTVLYACWWLAKTGAMYRWVLGEDLDVVEGYMRYFMFAAIPGFNLTRTVGPKFREIMSRVTMVTGVSKDTAPYMDEHFHRMCRALEDHFCQQGPGQLFLLGTPHPTLADVTLGAAFSSSFLTDDPPASVIAERYPSLVDYVERVTGWRGGVFVGDKVPLTAEDKDASGESQERTNPDEYPDVVPESLSGFFAIMAEVFPFMMSQCASFNAYMSSDAVRTLKREPLEAPWEGCHGYLLPQMTAIKSLMIIDNTVCSVQARAQDLEVAFLAAQEVMDEGLDSFGRDPVVGAEVDGSVVEGTRATADHAFFAKETKIRSMLAQGETDTLSATADGNMEAAVARDPSAEASGKTSPVEAADEEGNDGFGVRTRRRGSVILNRPADIADAEEADFYRVFTKKGLRQYGAVTLNRASIVERRQRDAPASRAASPALNKASQEGAVVATHGPTVYDHLKVLRDMLAKMRSPQYTLASVFHGRRIYVAAIPEYEVAKLRAKRAAAAAAAKQKGHATDIGENA